MVSALVYGAALLAFALPALSSPLLEDRAQCNRNNLLRCLDPTGTKATDSASRAAATAFCSSYLSIPVVTSVVDTVTPSITVTSTLTTTDATSVVVSTSVVLNTESSTVTETVTAPAGVNTAVPGKRAVVNPPKCLTTSAYQPADLTSACSCLSVAASTTYITATAPTATSISVIHDTKTSTTVTTTQTTTTTTGTSTTTTTTLPAPAPSYPCAPGEEGTVSNGRHACIVQNAGYYTGPAGNYFATTTPDLQTCLDICTSTYAARCVGIDWDRSGSPHTCFVLLDVLNGRIQLTGYDAVYLLPAQ